MSKPGRYITDFRAALRRCDSDSRAKQSITCLQNRLDQIKRFAPWPLLEQVLQQELDDCRRIAAEKGFKV